MFLKRGNMCDTGNSCDKTRNILKLAIPIFQALSDEMRQSIILVLAENGVKNVNDIASLIPLSRPAISHHLKILKNSGIISVEKRGTENYYYLTLERSVDILRALYEEMRINCFLK